MAYIEPQEDPYRICTCLNIARNYYCHKIGQR